MISKIKKPVSILLSLIIVFSMFAIVPLSASTTDHYDDDSVELPDVIKDCTYQQGENSPVYANVPFAAQDMTVMLDGAIGIQAFIPENGIIGILDAKNYSYQFYDETGTAVPAQSLTSTTAPGTNYGLSESNTVYRNAYQLTLPSPFRSLYIVATVPAPTYTVTWKNWNGDVLKTDAVAAGTTPSYDGATPVRPEDMNATYTFSAWDDGTTTYLIGEELPPVTGDITYTAVYTADIKKLFAGHSVTLGGDIGVNFFIDSNVAGLKDAETTVVKFAWDGGKYIKEVNLKELTPNEDGLYKVTVNVVAAQMAHTIEAVAYIDGKMFYTVDLYSVQEYAEAIYDDPAKYLSDDEAYKADSLKALAEAMLHCGAEAQAVFDSALNVKPERADSNVPEADYSAVTAGAVQNAINGTTSDLNAVAAQLGAKFYTSSLLYLSKNTLRLYFTPTGQEMPNAGAYDGSKSNYYYYKDHVDIPAAELDDQQSFTVGGGSWSTYVGCGNINVSGGTINARGGTNAPGIGSGCFGGCGDITIADTVILVTATKGTNAPNSIGAADSGSCGTIIIADPSKVTQN